MSAPTEDPIATATQPEVANVDARTVGLATGEDTNALGPLAQLPGVWANVGSHDARGTRMEHDRVAVRRSR